MSSKIKYSYYPINNNQELFYVEYRKSGNEKETWTLYKRHFFENMPDDIISSKEGHPYQLFSGFVNSNDNCEDLNTKKYLKFMVDSMNYYAGLRL